MHVYTHQHIFDVGNIIGKALAGAAHINTHCTASADTYTVHDNTDHLVFLQQACMAENAEGTILSLMVLQVLFLESGQSWRLLHSAVWGLYWHYTHHSSILKSTQLDSPFAMRISTITIGSTNALQHRRWYAQQHVAQHSTAQQRHGMADKVVVHKTLVSSAATAVITHYLL
jgi:hypothetical protein